MHMISKVLTQKGQTITPKELFVQLLLIQPKNTRYPKKRALASIGGSVTQGFIVKNSVGEYVRTR